MKKISTRFICGTLFIVIFSATLHASYYNRGKKYYIYKKYEKAKEMFLKSVESHPNGNAYYFLGEIEKLQQNYEKAEEYYKEAIGQKHIEKTYLRNTYWNLIVLTEQRADYEEVTRICINMWERLKDRKAKVKIEKIINKHLWSNNKEAKRAYAAAMKYKARKNPAKAKQLFQKAVDIDSTFLAPKFELGMMAYKQEETDQAIGYLGPIAQKVSFYGEVHLILAQIYYSKKYYSIAIGHFKKAEEFAFLSDSTKYYLYLKSGTSFFNLRDHDAAVEQINKAHQIRPKALKPLLLLSAIQIRQHQYDKALDLLHKANKIRPDNPIVLFQIGSIYYKQDDWRYLSYFDRLYNKIKNKKNNKYNKVLTILIRAHFEKENYKRVNQLLQDLPSDRYNYETTLITAKTHYRLKEYDKAIDHFEKISLNTNDKLLLCKAYYLSGQSEKAKQMILQLRYDTSFMEKAEKDNSLVAVIKQIEKEEEQKKKEEEQKRKKEQELLEKQRLEQAEKEKKERDSEPIKTTNRETDNTASPQ